MSTYNQEPWTEERFLMNRPVTVFSSQFLESLLRLAWKEAKSATVRGARQRTCCSVSVFFLPTNPWAWRRDCTEHKARNTYMLPHSGRKPQPHPPPNNSHECGDRCEWNVFVCKNLTIYSHSKTKSTKLYFLGGMLKSLKFIIWAHFCCGLSFLFRHKKRCCYCQECKPATQTKLLYLRSFFFFFFFCLSYCFEMHFSGTNNGTNFDVR